MRLKLYILLALVVPVVLFGENYSMLSYGEAGWYGQELKNHRTASGEVFNPSKFTAAHRKFPFGTLIRVTNLDNNQSVTVRVNDRGPLEKSKIIDLSKAAANKISFNNSNSIKVEIRVIKIGDGQKINYTKIEGRTLQIQDSKLNPTPHISEFKDLSPTHIDNNNGSNNGSFVIQVGAFKLNKNAQRLQESLKGQGFSVFVKNTTGYWRVFVGSFISKSDANSSLTRLKSNIPDAFIKRLN